MFRRRLLGVCLVLAALALVAMSQTSGDVASTKHRAVYPTVLPEAQGRELAERSCLMCHSAMLIVQQHKDSTGWEKTVKLMETWSAPLPPEEHGILIRYLTHSVGPQTKEAGQTKK